MVPVSCPACSSDDLNLSESTEVLMSIRDGALSSVECLDAHAGNVAEFECDECGEAVLVDVSLLAPSESL